MTESKELRIPHDDLVLLSIACKNCGTEITRDVRNPKQSTPADMHCPHCRHPFNAHLLESFTIFEAWRERVKQSGQGIIFRIPVDLGREGKP